MRDPAEPEGDQLSRQALDEDGVDPLDDLNRRPRDHGLTVCGEVGD